MSAVIFVTTLLWISVVKSVFVSIGRKNSFYTAGQRILGKSFLKNNIMNKTLFALLLLLIAATPDIQAQLLTLPNATNPTMWAGQRIGLTDITIRWNAPGVKGREGKIWGTSIAHYDFVDIGFGTAKSSPWRAGANECTTVEFSTDVNIEGKALAAGKYALFMALYPDSCTLIFNKNPEAWGTYFYKPEEDALRVTVRQQKDLPQSRELLAYTFSNPPERSVVIALEWERWRIPFKVEVDLAKTTVASLRRQLSGEMGFDPPSLSTAAGWCLTHDVNLEEALVWAVRATDPSLGGQQTFAALSTKAGLERKLGRTADADKTMQAALDNASVPDLHGYGRQLISEKKYQEALAVFQKNFDKHKGAWPTNVGLARGYSAVGDLKKALEHAKAALQQAPDDVNRKSLEAMVKTLSEGKPIAQ
jgi:tetratricopeptide (TPR) repeat protein